jgi:hypothetical protein
VPANGCDGHERPNAQHEIVRTSRPSAEQHRFSHKAAPLPRKRPTVVWQARALSTGMAQLVIDEAK